MMESASRASITALLDSIGSRRRELDEDRRINAERLSPDFGVFQFVETSEEGISRILAWMLDPSADHAQGDRFLNAFLSWLGLAWNESPLQRVAVQTEAPAASVVSTRFIDVLVTAPNFALAIENKIGAPDQTNQVRDYLSFLRPRFPNCCLLYLTPDGKEPSNESIPKPESKRARAENVLCERSYEALLEFVNECLKITRSDKVRHFLEDFSRHVSSSILGVENMEESAELAAEIAADEAKLRAALELYETEHHLKLNLMRKAQLEIEQRCAARKWMVEANIDGDGGDYLLVMFSAADTWGFGFYINRSSFRDMVFGFGPKEDRDGRRRPTRELLSLLNEVQKGKSDPYWPWWFEPQPHSPFIPYPRDWAGTKEFWIAVSDGTFAERVISFVSTMHTHIARARMLSSLR